MAVVLALFGLAFVDFFSISVVAIRLGFGVNRLYSYLRSCGRTASWEWLTSVGTRGPGRVNPVRAWRYIHNTTDCDDPEVVSYKRDLARDSRAFAAMGLAFLAFVAAAILAALVFAAARRGSP